VKEKNKKQNEPIKILPRLRREIAELKKKEAGHKQTERILRESIQEIRKTLQGAINTLASLVEIRDPYTAGHQKRVTKLACAIAREMGLSGEKINTLQLAATIHDIGKISVPFEILSKPTRLTQAEFRMIKTHSQIGYRFAKSINFPSPVAEIILQHHERMNGSGYPQGLSGKDIMIEARILAVADVVEAMSSHRPYRPALGLDKALREISKNKGIFYDPDVVDACVKLFTRKKFKFEKLDIE